MCRHGHREDGCPLCTQRDRRHPQPGPTGYLGPSGQAPGRSYPGAQLGLHASSQSSAVWRLSELSLLGRGATGKPWVGARVPLCSPQCPGQRDVAPESMLPGKKPALDRACDSLLGPRLACWRHGCPPPHDPFCPAHVPRDHCALFSSRCLGLPPTSVPTCLSTPFLLPWRSCPLSWDTRCQNEPQRSWGWKPAPHSTPEPG